MGKDKNGNELISLEEFSWKWFGLLCFDCSHEESDRMIGYYMKKFKGTRKNLLELPGIITVEGLQISEKGGRDEMGTVGREVN